MKRTHTSTLYIHVDVCTHVYENACVNISITIYTMEDIKEEAEENMTLDRAEFTPSCICKEFAKENAKLSDAFV